MKVIEPQAIIEDKNFDGIHAVALVENIGRVCYKSEAKGNENTTERFIKNLIKRGHTSVLEHVSISVRVVCDRGVSHEIVRHRIASYSQESTRYCNYSQDKFGRELTFIRPCWLTTSSQDIMHKNLYNIPEDEKVWLLSMIRSESSYFNLLSNGWTPQQARSVLPNSLKTEIVMTLNLRSWRNFFILRCDKSAHPQMRQVAFIILDLLSARVPYVFEDIVDKYKNDRV